MIEVAEQPLVVFGNSRRTGGEPCDDKYKYAVSLVCLDRADLLYIWHIVVICDLSGGILGTDIR